MNRITNLTKRDIFDLLKIGIQVKEKISRPAPNSGLIDVEEVNEYRISYYGRLEEMDFLSRLYNLDELPSNDSRYKNAYGDIWQHTVNNNDYEDYWVFSDSRFQLLHGDDKYFLNFVCEIFHPAVRDDKANWQLFYNTFKELLLADGYEIHAKSNISGRDIYGWRLIDSVEKEVPNVFNCNYELKMLGEGSYAFVYKFKDTFYNDWFVLKKAKKDLDGKELLRFKQEYEEMNNLNSMHVVRVFNFDEKGNQYTMEYMDDTLYEYIKKNNSSLTIKDRYNLVMQLLNVFIYLSDKQLLHRDISLTNVLLKMYEDTILLKISDFGLVKTTHSNLTSTYSELKGSLNDPQLEIHGFKNYEIKHETFALARVVYFIMTGRTKIDKYDNDKFKRFIEQGVNQDIEKRFKSVLEMKEAFKLIFNSN